MAQTVTLQPISNQRPKVCYHCWLELQSRKGTWKESIKKLESFSRTILMITQIPKKNPSPSEICSPCGADLKQQVFKIMDDGYSVITGLLMRWISLLKKNPVAAWSIAPARRICYRLYLPVQRV